MASTSSSVPRSASSATTASAVPRPGAASAPVLQWVRIRRAPASSSAPWRAIASLAATSSASIARASASAAAAPVRARIRPAAAAARTRSTAQARLTAVGRALASSSEARSSESRLGSRASASGDAIAAGDADQRRPADRQPLDRVGHLLGGLERQLALLARAARSGRSPAVPRPRSAARPGRRRAGGWLRPLADAIGIATGLGYACPGRTEERSGRADRLLRATSMRFIGLAAMAALALDPRAGARRRRSDHAAVAGPGRDGLHRRDGDPRDRDLDVRVHVDGVVDDPSQGARILVGVSGPAVAGTGIAEGFSGSPVYCPDAAERCSTPAQSRRPSAISVTPAGLVTPIQLMLGEPVRPPSDAPRFTGRARPAVGPLEISGLSSALLNVLQQAGSASGGPWSRRPGTARQLPDAAADPRGFGGGQLLDRLGPVGRDRHRHLSGRSHRVRVRSPARRRRPCGR